MIKRIMVHILAALVKTYKVCNGCILKPTCNVDSVGVPISALIRVRMIVKTESIRLGIL